MEPPQSKETYDLPAGYYQLVDLMTVPDEAQKAVEDDIFVKREQPLEERIERLNSKLALLDIVTRDQLILDFDYLMKQVEEQVLHKSRKYPKLYSISFRKSNSKFVAQKTAYPDLLQLLVNSDYTIVPTRKFTWADAFAASPINKGLIDTATAEKLAEQNAAMIEGFLREGDVVALSVGKDLFYYYAFSDAGQTWLAPFFKRDNYYYLPFEAIPFMKKNNLNNVDRVAGFYRLQNDQWIDGISNGKEFFNFAATITFDKNSIQKEIMGYPIWIRK